MGKKMTEDEILELMKTSNHKWKLDEDGRIDLSAVEVDYDEDGIYVGHNGPSCEVCHYSFCINCISAGYDQIEMSCEKAHQ
jgi:hypothetical protein